MKLLYNIDESNPLKQKDYTGEHLHLAVFIHTDSLLHCNILNSEMIFCNDLFW